MTDQTPPSTGSPDERKPNVPGDFRDALDRFIDAGFAAADASPQQTTLARLFASLDPVATPAAERDLLINVTVARVARQRDGGPKLASLAHQSEPAPLTAPSAGAIDAIEARGWNADSDDPAQRTVATLLGGLDADPGVTPEERASLIARTLDGIQSDIDRNQDRFRMDPVRELSGVRPRITLRDIASVAAMVLITGAIFWPMVVGLREASNERLCAHDLSQAGIGFALYANDHDDRLPARDLPRGPVAQQAAWWGVGESNASHSSNLFELVRNGYASLSQLSCPGNEHAPVEFVSEHQHDWTAPEELSFSYQLFAGDTPPRLNVARNTVLLTDKSPIIPRARAGEPFNPMARSLNHAGRGQNVLMNNLAVVFTQDPFKPGSRDNLWLPRHLEVGHMVPLTGHETPADGMDAFVGP